MGRGEQRRVGDVIPVVLKRLGLEGKMQEAELLRDWDVIVGEAVSKRCRPVGVRGGLLFIEAESNVWMQEISFRRHEILKRIKARFPGVRIKGIRIGIEREREAE